MDPNSANSANLVKPGSFVLTIGFPRAQYSTNLFGQVPMFAELSLYGIKQTSKPFK